LYTVLAIERVLSFDSFKHSIYAMSTLIQ